jgi:RNA-binding protein Luc7-like 2
MRRNDSILPTIHIRSSTNTVFWNIKGPKTKVKMDAQRALLDELMGRNRDGDKPNEEITDFRDKRVCKKFLCGLCPHDLFQNTKMDMGECMKLHLPKLRTKYEKERSIRDFGYEMELERDLQKYISDVERKIQRAQKRLEEQEGSKAPSVGDVENCKEVLELTAEIQEVMQQAEEAGNEGEVDLSMELMQKVEELKQKKADAQANAMLRSLRPATANNPEENNNNNGVNNSENKPSDPIVSSNPQHAGANVNQKLRVCDVCGAFLSIFDSDRRLADHFGGKLHLGYMQIRKKLEEIAASRKNTNTNNTGAPREDRKTSGGDNERSENRRHRRSRTKSRSRSRSR